MMMASGLVLLYSVMGMLSWIHGQLYMLGAILIYYLVVKLGINYFVGLPVTAAIVAIIGIAIEKGLLRPLAGKGFLPASVVCLGLIFVFEGGVTILSGSESKGIPAIFQGVIRIGSVIIGQEKLILVGLAIGIMFGLYLLINRSKLGLAIRASAQEPIVASLFGVSAGHLYTIVMGIGCALAAVAGAMIAPVFVVDPWIGAKPLILALSAIVLGGLGSLRGAVIGGMILGFFASVVAYYIGPWYELVSFLSVILIILLRPQGLFGQAEARV